MQFQFTHRPLSDRVRFSRWASILALIVVMASPGYAEEEPFNAESILSNFQTNLSSPLSSPATATPAASSKPVPREVGTTIAAIDVVGNRSVSSADILAAAELSPGTSVTPTQLERAVLKIKSPGIYDSVTATWVAAKNAKSGKKLLLTVKENPKIGTIRFEGASTIPTANLTKVLTLKSGDILNRTTLRTNIDAVRAELRVLGYVYASVYDTSVINNDGDDLVFYLSEGVIDEILVTGNTRTQPYVILREMDLRAGDPIIQEKLMADLRRIYKTNFFDDVRPEFLPGDRPRSQKLRIVVEERPAGTLSFGGGFGDHSSWFIYSDVKWTNVMGTGQTLGLKGQLGKTSSGQFSYYNPWAWGKRNSLAVKLWHTTGQFDAFGANSQYLLRNEVRTGAEVGVGTPITEEVSLSHTVHVEKVNVRDSTPYGLLSYRFGVSYDTRDVWFNPSKGVYHSAYYTKGLPWFGATEYQRFDLELRQFIPTFEKQTIAMRLDFGRITDNPISTETYFVGGQSSVRGYNETDPAEVRVGRNQVVGSLEYRFLISDQFQIVLFQDAGTASENFDHLFSSRQYIAGRGAGIRLTTPLGPLRFDLGFPTSGSMRIHFGIGNQF